MKCIRCDRPTESKIWKLCKRCFDDFVKTEADPSDYRRSIREHCQKLMFAMKGE